MIFDRNKMQYELIKFESKVISLISNGIVQRVPKRTTLKLIKSELLSKSVQDLDLFPAELNKLWWDAIKMYNAVSKKAFYSIKKQNKIENSDKNVENRSAIVYEFVKKYAIQNNALQKTAYDVSISAEGRKKHDDVYGYNGFIKKNQENLENYSPFFLCSVHTDCSSDHKDAQGKVYIDEDWKKFVNDLEIRKKISAYVKNRKIVSVQEVCSAPVYLITRPNCRHYFKNLPIDEVLSSSAKSLVRRHEMYYDKEYSVTPTKSVLNRYMKRLNIENELRKVLDTPKLSEDIKKDKQLIRKWKKMYLADLQRLKHGKD